MKHYQITLNDRTFDVKIVSDPHRDRVEVEVDGQAFTVGVKNVNLAVEAAEVEPIPGAAKAAPAGIVTSPLPGVIKSIAVQPGQQIAVDDELLVIEAMKMDNVIRAQRSGTIGTVFVSEGRQITHGEALLEYEA